jgi:hypothetical protein
MTRRSKTPHRIVKRRIVPAIAVVLAVLSATLLLALFAGAFSLLPAFKAEPEHSPVEEQPLS